jgi:Fe-S oxidoreductase
LSERDNARQQTVAEVQRAIDAAGVPSQDQYDGMIERNYDAAIWEEEAKRCVECGACNTICPTCHCFVLTDQQIGDQLCRFREWDACMLKDFARVAGGGNPRPQLWMRLRNRFEKKFDFFPQVADTYACTGCGRCISACPAQIDIRNVLKRLVDDV